MSAPAFLLFDLDGTLVDTAPELAAAVNALRVADLGVRKRVVLFQKKFCGSAQRRRSPPMCR